jgi:dolichyl-phosphate-mannose--protein O-mannosyl transferase
MANVTTNTRLYKIDTPGVLLTHGSYISKLVLIPNAAGDTATLVSWNPNETPDTSMDLKTVTVSSASILASTGNFESTEVSALDVIKIIATSTGNNLGTHLVLTRDSNDQITTSGSTLTNDVGATYSWRVWTPMMEAFIAADKTTGALSPAETYFEPRHFPNLAVSQLSASAVLYIYFA